MNTPSFPAHGPIQCRQCWGAEQGKVFTTSDGAFRVVNDPGAWGSATPEILVLGISKGFTQADAFASGEFDSVAFKNCRPRVRQTLAAIGLMEPDTSVDAAMRATETKYGWGSLVRCSLSGWNRKTQAFGAGTPDVLPAFRHAQAKRFLNNCMRRHLQHLPAQTRLVALLGNDDRYIETVGTELRSLYPADYTRINPVAHRTGAVLWVHAAHPSPGNGHFTAFLTGSEDSTQGRKRELARAAVRQRAGA